MATLDKSIITPSAASTIVDEAFQTTNDMLPLSNVFPLESNNGETTVHWTPNLPVTQTEKMNYRAWDGEAGYGKTTESSIEKYGGLLPLSKKAHISERDIITHKSDMSWMRTDIENHLKRMGMEAAVTAELLRIPAIVDAKFTIKENGVNAEYDFERPAALNNLTPAKKWTVADATPEKDIEGWIAAMEAANGGLPSAVITTRAVIQALRTNKSVITDYTNQSKTNAPESIKAVEVLEWLRIHGLTDVRLIDEMYTQVERENGFKLPVNVSTLIPDATFIMFSSFNDLNLGATYMGPTVEAATPEYEINRSDKSGMVGYVMYDNAPTRYDVWTNGSLMPILKQAVSTLKANVL